MMTYLKVLGRNIVAAFTPGKTWKDMRSAVALELAKEIVQYPESYLTATGELSSIHTKISTELGFLEGAQSIKEQSEVLNELEHSTGLLHAHNRITRSRALSVHISPEMSPKDVRTYAKLYAQAHKGNLDLLQLAPPPALATDRKTKSVADQRFKRQAIKENYKTMREQYATFIQTLIEEKALPKNVIFDDGLNQMSELMVINIVRGGILQHGDEFSFAPSFLQHDECSMYIEQGSLKGGYMKTSVKPQILTGYVLAAIEQDAGLTDTTTQLEAEQDI